MLGPDGSQVDERLDFHGLTLAFLRPEYWRKPTPRASRRGPHIGAVLQAPRETLTLPQPSSRVRNSGQAWGFGSPEGGTLEANDATGKIDANSSGRKCYTGRVTRARFFSVFCRVID